VIEIGESFFDWEKKFEKSRDHQKESKNSLGVDSEQFKQMVKKWRKKNLSGSPPGSESKETNENNGERVIGQVHSSLPDDK